MQIQKKLNKNYKNQKEIYYPNIRRQSMRKKIFIKNSNFYKRINNLKFKTSL